MRARNIKPSLLTNELLASSDPLHTVVFAGLWMAADREGRLEDRPLRLHMLINPMRSFEGTEVALQWLATNGFILRYSVSENKYIQIVRFSEHQKPHVNEAVSKIPPADGDTEALAPKVQALAPKVQALGSDSLIPDSPQKKKTSSSGKSATRKRVAPASRRVPSEWTVSPELATWCKDKYPALDVPAQVERFRDHEFAQPHSDWDAAFRNWMRRAAESRVAAQPAGLAPWKADMLRAARIKDDGKKKCVLVYSEIDMADRAQFKTFAEMSRAEMQRYIEDNKPELPWVPPPGLGPIPGFPQRNG